MTTGMAEEEVYEEAKRRVKAKREFYSHLGAWALVNVILVVVWALSGGGYLWFLWCLGIWGVFVLAHFVQVFVFKPKSDKEAVEKEAEKIRREQR